MQRMSFARIALQPANRHDDPKPAKNCRRLCQDAPHSLLQLIQTARLRERCPVAHHRYKWAQRTVIEIGPTVLVSGVERTSTIKFTVTLCGGGGVDPPPLGPPPLQESEARPSSKTPTSRPALLAEARSSEAGESGASPTRRANSHAVTVPMSIHQKIQGGYQGRAGGRTSRGAVMEGRAVTLTVNCV
jgi:hypothetical protein